MKRTTRLTRFLALTLLAGAGCGGTSGYDYSYYDPYSYYSYYPADVAYSSYYWTDPWGFYYIDYGTGTTNPGTTTGTGGSSGTSNTLGRITVGDTIRALARGESQCPNQVTVTPKSGPAICATDGTTMVRDGVNIAFNACQLTNGGQVDGTFDVQVTRTPSDPNCGAGTTITLMDTTTLTNLSFTGTSGRKAVIPSSTSNTTINYAVGQAPATAATNLMGRLQVLNSDGSMLIDQIYTGNFTTTPSSDKSTRTIDGTLNLQDQRAAGTATLQSMGVVRTNSCCLPTAGTVTLDRTGGANPGSHTWTYGPNCGQATFDGSTVTPSCL